MPDTQPATDPERTSGSVAWQDGDPPADRQFLDVGPVDLEYGGRLPSVRVAYETWGSPVRDGNGGIANAVLVEHALTGDAHVSGPAGPGQPSPGWWDGLIGPGRPLDTNDMFVVASNVLGGCQGTTGPASPRPDGRPWGSQFPRVTIRDQVAIEARLADRLGIERFCSVLGGSMGGMRALEWAATLPDRVGSVLVLASSAYASADQIGTQTVQIQAVTSDPDWRGGDYHAHRAPATGLGIARRIAHLTYRSETELHARFGRDAQPGEDPERGGRFAVQSYLDHHAVKLERRFDAGSYVVLTEAMNTHDLGRGRGGVEATLASIRVPVVVAGIDTDRLYPVRLQQEIADLVPTSDGLHLIASPYGHDGFLIELDAVGPLVRHTLALAVAATAST